MTATDQAIFNDWLLDSMREWAQKYYDANDKPYGDPVIYILEFATGIVKVGQTSNYRERVSSYRHHHAVRGHTIIREWWQRTSRALEDERVLVALAHDLGGTILTGREWFVGVPADELIARAETATEAAPRPPLTFNPPPTRT